ncbi:MAG: CinA family protein [Acholeplasmataceae bacterium]|nr:CinA family protein [Acholeplasmataceae bacterium]
MISKNVFRKLLEKGLTIAFAESMTGGALAFEMIKNPGSSEVIQGSVVAYNESVKINLLGISKNDIERFGVVSEGVASLMSNQIRSLFKSSIGVGVTGNAGPKCQSENQQKEVWIAISNDHQTKTHHLVFDKETRLQTIRKTVLYTYQKLLEII